MKAKTHGAGPWLTQACIVPRWTPVAGLQMRHLAAVELEIACARQQQRVIDGLGPVHEFGRAGGEFGDPDDGALARADVVVAGDEPLALGGVGGLRIVGRHPIGRPDFAAGARGKSAILDVVLTRCRAAALQIGSLGHTLP